MKRIHTPKAILAAIAVAAIMSGCDAMWDTSVSVPLGYGGSLGIGLSAPLFSGNWLGNGLGWNPPAWVNPTPVVPPLKQPANPQPTVRPPQTNNNINWRPAVNGGNAPFTTSPATLPNTGANPGNGGGGNPGNGGGTPPANNPGR